MMWLKIKAVAKLKYIQSHKTQIKQFLITITIKFKFIADNVSFRGASWLRGFAFLRATVKATVVTCCQPSLHHHKAPLGDALYKWS